jgi:type I restriction enzyme S subunit
MTPEGWRAIAIGDFAQQVSDRARMDDLPVLSVSKDLGIVLQSEKFKRRIASENTSNYKRIRYGQFVYDPMLLWAGNVGRQRRVTEGVVSPAYTVFKVGDDVDSDFLLYFLKRPEMLPFYKGISRGTNVRRQKALFCDFAALRFPLPPLPEQRKIAAILSSVDGAIEGTQVVIDQLQVVKKAMMADLLTRGIPGRHKTFRMTEIGEVPVDWEVVQLDACIESGRPICYGILMPGQGHPGGVPVVKVKNIRNGVVDTTDLLLTSPEIDRQYARSRLRPNDVLLTIRGTTGRLARVPAELADANITQDTARLTIRTDISTNYIFYCLQSEASQRQIQEHTRGQAVKGINIGDVRLLRLPVPGREEQEQIVAVFQAMALCDEQNRLELAALRSTKSALMSVLLTGEVRVRVDEEDAA